jgi:hypothetical protein
MFAAGLRTCLAIVLALRHIVQHSALRPCWHVLVTVAHSFVQYSSAMQCAVAVTHCSVNAVL